MARFACDKCPHEMAASDALIGRKAKCPKCGGRGHIYSDAPETASESASAVTPLPPFRISLTDEHPNTLQSLAPNTSSIDPRLPFSASVIILLAFGALGLLTIGGAVLLIVSLASANGAPQEAAIAAIFAAFFIAGYIVTRSIEKVVRSFVRR